MTPALARSGALPNDPKLGSPEYVRMVALHDEAVAREAKLRRMQSALPQAIADAELRVRDLAGRLGLAQVTTRERRLPPGVTRGRVLAALPAAAATITRTTGLTDTKVNGALRNMRREGLVTRDLDGVWRRVESVEEAA